MRFREVLRPPLWLLALIYFFFLSLVLSIWAALGNSAALFTLIGVTLILLLIYFKGALVIEVDENELRVGSAHISHQYLGQATWCNATTSKMLRTRDADPAAHLAIRFWHPETVQIPVNDPRDKTPYWLITSKEGVKLVEALQKQS